MPLENLIDINAYRQALYGDGGWSDLPDILYGDEYDDWYSDFLYTNLTDRSWEDLYNTQPAMYDQEGSPATHTLPGPDGPIEVYESNGKIFDAGTGQEVVDQTQAGGSLNPEGAAIWELPVWGPRQSGSTASSGGGVQGAIDAITGAITGATGGAQNPNTIWDPINRQYGQGVLKKILGGVAFNELVNTSGLGYESGPAVNPTPSPTQSTYGGAPGPVREVPVVFPTPESPVQGQSHSTAGAPGPRLSIPAVQSPVSSPGTSTDAGGGGPRYYTGTAQSPVSSPETSTDAGGGGPRRGPGDNDGVDPDPTDGTPTFPYKDMNFTLEDYNRLVPSTTQKQLQGGEWDQFIDELDPLQKKTIGKQSDWLGDPETGAYTQMYDPSMDLYGGFGQDIFGKGLESLGAFMGIEGQPTYQDVTQATAAANPLIGGMQNQASMLGQQIEGLLGSAGTLNARERANVEDSARGRYAAMGRGGDTAALATEIGDVVEAERLDRERTLNTAGGLMQVGQGAAESVSNLQNQFVSPFFRAGETMIPGMNVASNVANVAGSMGLSPWDMIGLEGTERQSSIEQAGLESAKDAANAQELAAILGFVGNLAGSRFGGSGSGGGLGGFGGFGNSGYTGLNFMQ